MFYDLDLRATDWGGWDDNIKLQVRLVSTAPINVFPLVPTRPPHHESQMCVKLP